MNIPEKESMRYFGQGVYTDEKLVYKFGNDYFNMGLFDEVDALKRVADLPNTQQFVDYDEKENLLVTELVQGNLLTCEIEAFHTGKLPYTQPQVKSFLENIVEMKDRGVELELHPGNLLFSKEKGFISIDYETKPYPEVSIYSILNTLTLQNIPENLFHTQFPRTCSSRAVDVEKASKMIVDTFYEVDAKEADEAMESFEKIHKNISSYPSRFEKPFLIGKYFF